MSFYGKLVYEEDAVVAWVVDECLNVNCAAPSEILCPDDDEMEGK